MKTQFGILLLATLFISCQKEIEVDLPPIESRLVVEGTIENGQPPIVFISESQGFFDPVDVESLTQFYVGGASLTIENNGTTYPLQEVCTDQLPEEFLETLANQLGFDPIQLQEFPICAYTSFALLGEFGEVYRLSITTEDGQEMRAVTKITEQVVLDERYFQVVGNSDSLGFIYATITDPDTLGNAYRWFAKRINKYPEWSEHAGEQKDSRFIAPIGSSYDDSFFNGLSFEFAYFRGNEWQSSKEDDRNEEFGYFKVGDTVVVKGCTIDYGVYRYVTSFESNFSSAGSPFTFPANVESNVEGGLGVFAGYGAYIDTLICTP